MIDTELIVDLKVTVPFAVTTSVATGGSKPPAVLALFQEAATVQASVTWTSVMTRWSDAAYSGQSSVPTTKSSAAATLTNVQVPVAPFPLALLVPTRLHRPVT